MINWQQTRCAMYDAAIRTLDSLRSTAGDAKSAVHRHVIDQKLRAHLEKRHFDATPAQNLAAGFDTIKWKLNRVSFSLFRESQCWAPFTSVQPDRVEMEPNDHPRGNVITMEL